MQDKYSFPALFCYGDAPDDEIGVVFPDLPGCVSQAGGETEALRMAKEALSGHLYCMEEIKAPIPEPTPLNKVEYDADQRPVLVDVWMPPFRDRMNNKAVSKTVTIPRWLDLRAKEAGLSFSRILQNGIMDALGIPHA